MVESIAATTRSRRYVERPDDQDIDEVFPRIYQSGYAAARNISLLQQLGVTHILIVTPYAKQWHP